MHLMKRQLRRQLLELVAEQRDLCSKRGWIVLILMSFDLLRAVVTCCDRKLCDTIGWGPVRVAKAAMPARRPWGPRA